LSIERPFQLGDQVLLEGGVEGEVIELNWRATHLRNGANDIVVIPNSAIVKMRIQNHSSGSKRHSGSLAVPGDYFAEYSLLTGVESQATFTALTSGVLLEWNAEHLKPILAARPELANSLSHSMATVQLLLANVDKDASHRAEIPQKQLLSRIKDFFHLPPTLPPN
jgi:CRP-like cAMP-binding protein